MQEQNRQIYKKLKKKEVSSGYKIYFINGDATKWSLSDIVETMIICIDELRGYLTESLSEMMIFILKTMKTKILRLSREEQSLLYEIKSGSKPLISQAAEYMLEYTSEDLRELTTSVGWFQGILNKLSGLKHAATSELFEHLSKKLVSMGVISEFEYESLVHSDDWNLIVLCKVMDIRTIYALIKFCKATANIKDSSKKTNVDDFIREFISDYSVNLGTEEPFIKYICTLSFTPSMNGYESDMLESISKITSHTDRGSGSIFDDFMIRLTNYVISDVYSMRKGQYNDPTNIFKLERDLIPIELGGICYEESSAITNCGAKSSNMRLVYHPSGKKLMNKLITVGKSLLINNEAFRDDYIYSNTLIAITSSYSKTIKALRSEFPLSLKDIEKMKAGELAIEDLAMPDFPQSKVDYMVKRFHTVSYARAFENSDLAKQALKLAIATKQSVVTIGEERYSYRSAFNLVNSLYEVSNNKIDFEEGEIKDMIFLHNNYITAWHDLRRRIQFPSLVENNRSLSYVNVGSYTSSLSLINETSRIIMYEKKGQQFLSDNGFRIKSIASVEADINSIKRIYGPDCFKYPDLELYKILNSAQYGKTIIRTAGNIRSFADYFRNMYTYNIYPYKMAKGAVQIKNKKMIFRSVDLIVNSDEDVKAILIRCSNYVNANIISRRFEKTVIRRILEESCVSQEPLSSMFNRLSTSDYNRLFRENDLPVLYSTFSYLGYDMSELGKLVSGMNTTGSISNLNSDLNIEKESEETDEDSIVIKLKKKKAGDDSYIMLRLQDYTMMCNRFEDEILMELNITDKLSTLNKDRLDVLIRGLFRMIKIDLPEEGLNMLDVLCNPTYSKFFKKRNYLLDKYNFYYIDKISKTLTDARDHDKIVPGIRIRINQRSHQYHSSSLQMILRNNSSLAGSSLSTGNEAYISVDLVDNRGSNIDYVIGERTFPVRAISDRGIKKIEGRLVFKGVNYFSVDICSINEVVLDNFLKNPKHFSVAVNDELLEDIAYYLYGEIRLKGFDEEKEGRYINDGFERNRRKLEQLTRKGMLRIHKEVAELKKGSKTTAEVRDDVSSASSASVGATFDLFDMSDFNLDEMESMLQGIEAPDEEELNLSEFEALALLSNNAPSNTLRKLLYRITSNNFLSCLFRSALSRRSPSEGVLITELKNFDKLITKVVLEGSINVQTYTMKLFIITFINDLKTFLKGKKQINWSSIKKELLGKSTDTYRRINFNKLFESLIIPEELESYETSSSSDELDSEEDLEEDEDSDDSEVGEAFNNWAEESETEID